jgi:hypothetical protein
MQLLARAAAIGLALVATVAAAAPDVAPPARRSTDLPPPRDGDVAVRQELEAARRARTLAAYDLFIARHPGHPLIETARRERARLIHSGH